MHGKEALDAWPAACRTRTLVQQAAKTWRSGRADDFSLPMLAMLVAGVAQWRG